MIGPLILGVALLAFAPQQAKPPDQAEAQARALAEYNGRRAELPPTAEAHWKLGLWAEQKGLKGEASVEFLDVVRLDPSRDAAWKKLGYERHGGRWVAAEEVAAEKAEAEARRKGDAQWLPVLRKARTLLAQKGRQSEAEATLAEIKDPRAIPSIWKVFGQGTPEDQERAIDVLGRIEGEPASKALAGLGLFGKTDLVRKAAVETLTRRNPDDVLMLWIGLLQKPVKYEVRQVAGPGSPGYLTVEGEKYNVRRSYSPPSMSGTQEFFLYNSEVPRPKNSLWTNSKPVDRLPPGSKYVGWDMEHGSLYVYDYHFAPPEVPKKVPDPSAKYQQFETSRLQAKVDSDFEINETANMAAGAQAQLQQDVATLEAGNATIRELNARLAEALRRVSGRDLGDDKEAWLKWYMERRGYKYVAPADRPKPTVDVQVPLPYVPQSGPPVVGGGGGGNGGGRYCLIYDHEKGQQPTMNKCFAAGTAVLTPDGPRPIETLRAGDRILAGDGPDFAGHPGTIRSVHHSRATRTLSLATGDETILTTEGHPLWKLGHGWSRAGDLRVGDEVATRSGPAIIRSVEAREAGEVWNLDVADGSTYFVGRSGLIAHDLGPIADVAR